MANSLFFGQNQNATALEALKQGSATNATLPTNNKNGKLSTPPPPTPTQSLSPNSAASAASFLSPLLPLLSNAAAPTGIKFGQTPNLQQLQAQFLLGNQGFLQQGLLGLQNLANVGFSSSTSCGGPLSSNQNVFPAQTTSPQQQTLSKNRGLSASENVSRSSQSPPQKSYYQEIYEINKDHKRRLLDLYESVSKRSSSYDEHHGSSSTESCQNNNNNNKRTCKETLAMIMKEQNNVNVNDINQHILNSDSNGNGNNGDGDSTHSSSNGNSMATTHLNHHSSGSLTVKSLRQAQTALSPLHSNHQHSTKTNYHLSHQQGQQANSLSSVSSIPANQLRAHVARADADEITDLEELEQFAKTFKQRRIKLGKN